MGLIWIVASEVARGASLLPMFCWLRLKLFRGLIAMAVGIALLPSGLALPLAGQDAGCPTRAAHAATVAVATPDLAESTAPHAAHAAHAAGQVASSDGCVEPLQPEGPCSGADCGGLCAVLLMGAVPALADALAHQPTPAVLHGRFGRIAPPETPPPIR